jgi:hypothetical protein
MMTCQRCGVKTSGRRCVGGETRCKRCLRGHPEFVQRQAAEARAWLARIESVAPRLSACQGVLPPEQYEATVQGLTNHLSLVRELVQELERVPTALASGECDEGEVIDSMEGTVAIIASLPQWLATTQHLAERAESAWRRVA